MKRFCIFIVTICMCISPALVSHAQDKAPQQGEKTPEEKQDSAHQEGGTPSEKTEQKESLAENKDAGQKAQKSPDLEKKDLGGEEIYFDVTYLNLFDYGLGFFYGFEANSYGFSAILEYRHLNTFTGFPGVEGGTCAALDLFVDAGATVASVYGKNTIGGFVSLTAASNILWFKPLAQGNYDRSGNGIFIGAKIQGDFDDKGFTLSYGPAIGWTTLHYNTEKRKFRVTNVTLFFYPPTLLLGISATTSF